MSWLNRCLRRGALVGAAVAATAVAVPVTASAGALAPAVPTAMALPGPLSLQVPTINPACLSPNGPLGPSGPLGPAGPFGPGGPVASNPALFYPVFYSVWVANPAIGGLSSTCFGLDLTGVFPAP